MTSYTCRASTFAELVARFDARAAGAAFCVWGCHVIGRGELVAFARGRRRVRTIDELDGAIEPRVRVGDRVSALTFPGCGLVGPRVAGVVVAVYGRSWVGGPYLLLDVDGRSVRSRIAGCTLREIDDRDRREIKGSASTSRRSPKSHGKSRR